MTLATPPVAAVLHEKLRIAGRKVDGAADGHVEVFNPYNNAVVGTVPRASQSVATDRPSR